MKTLNKIVAPKTPHFVGDGFRVHNFIPGVVGMDMKQMDPFIMLDYNSKYNFPPSNIPKGVGVHPHKGFETVTIAYKGRVEHGDSSGGGGIIGEGDVQWMTAGAGVLHKEFHETEWSKTGGEFQMVQLWVNLPKAHKNTPAKYQSIGNSAIERYTLDNNLGEIEIIAGNYKDIQGSASTFSPIHMYNIKAKVGAKIDLNFPKHYNTILLVIDGSMKINGSNTIHTDHLALMNHDGDDFIVEMESDGVVLVLSGDPLNEPIAHYGPFVMNTEEELTQAFKDFQQGKFGNLS
ncbi:MAG: pirin family protein [Myroides sp.]